MVNTISSSILNMNHCSINSYSMSAIQIKRVKVEKLFGLYDYDFSKEGGQNPSSFMILYGDNGTGKSTILKILYHLLSSEDHRGHKSQLANIQFRKISIELADGAVVEANRSSSPYVGDYSLKYTKADLEVACSMKCHYREDEKRYYIPASNNAGRQGKLEGFLKLFRDHNIMYISDDRKGDNYRRTYTIDNEAKFGTAEPEEIVKEMRALQEWIIARVLEETKKGEEGSSEVYSRILANFTNRPLISHEERSISSIQYDLQELTRKSERLVQLGFITNPDYNSILSKISRIDKRNEEVVYNIFAPYLEIQKNKLNAMDDMADKVIYFTQSLNDYLYRKSVEYSVSRGLSIYPIENRTPIAFSKLSSGEKQLLLLLGKVIRASTQDSLIIIDEPEISLNVKWQRTLLDTMKYLVGESSVQFVIATHSFEILSGHIQDTISLNDSALID